MAGISKLTMALVGGLSAVFGTAVGSSLDYLFGRETQRAEYVLQVEKAAELERREQQAKAYLDFFLRREEFEEALLDLPEGGSLDEKLLTDYRLARYRVVIYGSPEVVKALAAFMREHKAAQFAELLRAVRKGYQHYDTVVEEKDVLALICPAKGKCFEKTDNEHLRP